MCVGGKGMLEASNSKGDPYFFLVPSKNNFTSRFSRRGSCRCKQRSHSTVKVHDLFLLMLLT